MERSTEQAETKQFTADCKKHFSSRHYSVPRSHDSIIPSASVSSRHHGAIQILLLLLLTAKAIRISHAKFHCNRLTTVQDIQDYASLIFLAHSVDMNPPGMGSHQP